MKSVNAIKASLFSIGLAVIAPDSLGQLNPVERVHNVDTVTFNNSLNPQGDLVYFTQVAQEQSRIIIYQGSVVDGKVTSTTPLLIDGVELDGSDIHISPDGTKLLYSARSAFQSDGELGDYNLYISHKKAQGWSRPQALPEVINSSSDEFYPSLTNSGDIYFSRRIKDQNLDLFVSRLVNGRYQQAQRLPDTVNTNILEGDGFIAPDESYLVFARMKGSDSLGMTDLYISYKDGDGWSQARNLGAGVNSKGIDGSPFVSRDGRWLYFTSNREGQDPTKFDQTLGLYRTPFGPYPVLNDTSSIDYGGSLSPDGKALYYTHAADGFKQRQVMRALLQQGRMVEQGPLLMGGKPYQGSDVQVSPDGTKLVFKTRANLGELSGRKDGNIYMSNKSASGWQTPVPLPAAVNSEVDEYYPVLTNSGNLYFSRVVEGKSYDIFVSRLVNGRYQEAVALTDRINTALLESDAYISPDESFMVFVRMGEGMGVSDLYLSENQDGNWSQPINLGPSVNFEGVDGSPFVTADKKWLYFTSNRASISPDKFDSTLGIFRTALVMEREADKFPETDAKGNTE